MLRKLFIAGIAIFFIANVLNNVGSGISSYPQTFDEFIRILGFVLCGVGFALSVALLGTLGSKNFAIAMILSVLFIGDCILSLRSAGLQIGTIETRASDSNSLRAERAAHMQDLYPTDGRVPCEQRRNCVNSELKQRVAEISEKLDKAPSGVASTMMFGGIVNQITTLVIALGPSLGGLGLSIGLGLLPPPPPGTRKKAKPDEVKKQPSKPVKAKNGNNILPFKTGLSSLKNRSEQILNRSKSGLKTGPSNPITGFKPVRDVFESGTKAVRDIYSPSRLTKARKLVLSGVKPSFTSLKREKLQGTKTEILEALRQLCDEQILSMPTKNGSGYKLNKSNEKVIRAMKTWAA